MTNQTTIGEIVKGFHPNFLDDDGVSSEKYIEREVTALLHSICDEIEELKGVTRDMETTRANQALSRAITIIKARV